MKKQVITTAVLLLFIIPGIVAQKVGGKNIPDAVKTTMIKEYPSITKLKWEKEKENYEASFVLSKTPYSVLLDAKGNILEREVGITADVLPPTILAYVKQHYPGKKVTELAKITDAKNEVTYEVEVKGMDLIFDNKGNFLKEQKD